MAGAAGGDAAGAVVGSGAELSGSGVDSSRGALTALVANGGAWRGR
jgi:hypothetical protein